MNKIVVATKNRGKIAEIKEILIGLPVEVLSMDEIGLDLEIIEDGKSLEENALIKAREVRKYTNDIIISDDSGLMVDAIGGAPGIYSSRFSGEDATDDSNNAKLLSILEGVIEEERTARFMCTIAVIMSDGREFSVNGTCEGVIGFEKKGATGFGYDPLFIVPEYGKTMAELGPEIKNKISHRAKALEKFKVKIEKYL